MTDVFGADFLDRLHGAGAVQNAAAFAALRERGFPNRRVEAWRYTDLAGPLGKALTPAGLRINQEQSGLFGPIPLADVAAPASDQPGTDALSLLNASLAGEGFLLDVPEKARLKPIFARFGPMAENALVNAANRIRLAEDAQATLVERWGNTDDSWLNSDTEIDLAPGAHLTRIILVEDGGAGTQTHRTSTRLGENARYDCLVVTLGGGLHRIEQHADINAPGAHAGLAALVLKTGSEHSDFVTGVRHLAADTTSDQQVRTVVDQQATAIFQGGIHVAQDSQRIEGDQLSRALMLSDSAQAFTKPELEIFADDVKCSHGATVGDLSEEALFYLRARGVSEATACALLILAFAREPFAALDLPEAVEAMLDEKVKAWLGVPGAFRELDL
ncbi:MAG: SufD family Fe-S cluster assembly protein [Pseudomonadota bacterium]|nr:SufD family Fe-S cluster assembly protein [Pseudomonadota bacterium]